MIQNINSEETEVRDIESFDNIFLDVVNFVDIGTRGISDFKDHELRREGIEARRLYLIGKKGLVIAEAIGIKRNAHTYIDYYAYAEYKKEKSLSWRLPSLSNWILGCLNGEQAFVPLRNLGRLEGLYRSDKKLAKQLEGLTKSDFFVEGNFGETNVKLDGSSFTTKPKLGYYPIIFGPFYTPHVASHDRFTTGIGRIRGFRKISEAYLKIIKDLKENKKE